MKNKAVNSIFYISLVVLILACAFFFFTMQKKYVQAQAGLSVGGRVISVIPLQCPVQSVCTCSATYLTQIMPYGGANQPIICPTVGMLTSGPPIVPGFSGFILGLFSILQPLAMPIGLVGTSL